MISRRKEKEERKASCSFTEGYRVLEEGGEKSGAPGMRLVVNVEGHPEWGADINFKGGGA